MRIIVVKVTSFYFDHCGPAICWHSVRKIASFGSGFSSAITQETLGRWRSVHQKKRYESINQSLRYDLICLGSSPVEGIFSLLWSMNYNIRHKNKKFDFALGLDVNIYIYTAFNIAVARVPRATRFRTGQPKRLGRVPVRAHPNFDPNYSSNSCYIDDW